MSSNADPRDMRVVVELSPEEQLAFVAQNKAEMELMQAEITIGEKGYTVRGTVTFELSIYEVDGPIDCHKIAETLEMKLSPWATHTADIIDQEVEVEDIERDDDLEDDEDDDPDGYDPRET